MDDKRNLIMAIVLTAIVLFGWQYIVERFFPAPEAPEATASKDGSGTQNSDEPTLADTDVAPGADANPADGSAKAAKGKSVSLQTSLKGSARVLVETPKLRGSINLTGAKIDDLVLLSHRQKLPKDSPPVRLFAPADTQDAYFARFGWVGKGIIAPDAKTVWSASAQKLTPDSPVTLTHTNAQNQTFEIVFSIDENYLITADQRFTNRGEAAASVATFGILRREGESPDAQTSFWNVHVGPMGVFDEQPDYDWGYDDVAEAPNNEAAFKSTGGWLGFTDKYWLGALIADQSRKINAKFLERDGAYITQMVTAKQTSVAPGKKFEQTSRLFAGAKEVEILEKYTSDHGIPYLDYSIDWGWFWFIAKPFFWILNWLFGLVGNFGVAIIGLTIIVRLLLFPIAQKQFASMAQMRAVQPKMKQLQERFKDDKQKQQQEIMKLYKDEKVNPLAGCLPILLQIPIFFALYKLLLLSIEMRHQPFMLWLEDLSAPDPLTPVNLFGLLDFQPPALLAIGILPILLGLTMWLMQRLNPQPMDEIQKQVFAIMPWFLMFIMAPFAAGLQLYWVVSNIISIGQQKLLYSRHPQLKQQMAEELAKKQREKEEKESEA